MAYSIWEYDVLTILYRNGEYTETIKKALDAKGFDGWEAFDIYHEPNNLYAVVTFKRSHRHISDM